MIHTQKLLRARGKGHSLDFCGLLQVAAHLSTIRTRKITPCVYIYIHCCFCPPCLEHRRSEPSLGCRGAAGNATAGTCRESLNGGVCSGDLVARAISTTPLKFLNNSFWMLGAAPAPSALLCCLLSGQKGNYWILFPSHWNIAILQVCFLSLLFPRLLRAFPCSTRRPLLGVPSGHLS